VRALTLVACLLSLGVLPRPALAIDSNIGFSKLSFVCPSQQEINFAWSPVDGAAGYSLQLVGPLDPGINGGISGTFLRQFGTTELSKGQMNNAAVSLNGSTASPLILEFEVMVLSKNGYAGLVPAQQMALVPIPCNQNSVEVTTH